MHTEGAEKCSKALDTVVQLPEAKELLRESFDRFRDVTCIGLSNWANVHLCMAKKLMEHAAQNGKRIKDVEAEFQEHCQSSIQRYNEAIAYNRARHSHLPVMTRALHNVSVYQRSDRGTSPATSRHPLACSPTRCLAVATIAVTVTLALIVHEVLQQTTLRPSLE
jgi:hypothetical protein